MFTDVKSASRAVRAPVCVLLGGSGQRATHPQRSSRVPALLRPRLGAVAQAPLQDRSEPALVEA